VQPAARPLAPGTAPEWPEDAVEVGRVMGAWGIQGGLRIKPFAADPQALFSSKRWYLRAPEAPHVPAARPGSPWPALLRVVAAREQGDAVVATVQEITDRDAAEALRGGRIFVSRASFPTPDADEFYWIDLIGLAVANRQSLLLGEVVGLIETGPHCVIRVRPADATAPELLIPFVSAYVDGVDLAGRRITVDWEADF
jgi:16S rRNA processing protein RimM